MIKVTKNPTAADEDKSEEPAPPGMEVEETLRKSKEITEFYQTVRNSGKSIVPSTYFAPFAQFFHPLKS